MNDPRRNDRVRSKSARRRVDLAFAAPRYPSMDWLLPMLLGVLAVGTLIVMLREQPHRK